jgi:hypothetical protein
MPRERIVAALADAAKTLADPSSDEGRGARAALAASSGLSVESVAWALRTTVGAATPRAFADIAVRLEDGPPIARARLAVFVLAGNVFTAPFRPTCHALLARVPVVAKASSKDDAFARLFRAALRGVDPEVAASFDSLTFPGGSADLEASLFAAADVVGAFGSDATLADIRARLPATTTFVAHGHGIGAAFVPAAAVANTAQAHSVVERLALDVAAYDQRGCLSPHAIFVEAAANVSPRDLAARLHGELGRLAASMPRGPFPIEAGAAQIQWRGVAAIRGQLFEGDGWAVSCEGDGPLRVSPGYRNVAVLEVADEHALFSRLAPLGVHLKALGVAAPEEWRRAFAHRLPRPLCPRVSDVGAMQTPPLDALADGLDPFTGLVRHVDLA